MKNIEELQAENADLLNVISRQRVDNERLVRTLMRMSGYVVDLRSDLRALRPQVTQWQPIEEWDRPVVKPSAIFAKRTGPNSWSTSPIRNGLGDATHFCVLPEYPTE